MSHAKRALVGALLVVATALMATAAGATIRLQFLQPGHDRFQFHGRLNSPSGTDASTYGITITLSNASGTLLRAAIPPHACVQHGGLCRYGDKNAAKTKTGVASFLMYSDTSKMYPTAYGDLSAATNPHMTVTVDLHGRQAEVDAVFKKTSGGWVLSNKDWP